MSQLYGMLGISKQAVHQHQERRRTVADRSSDLFREVDRVRRLHPGCGMRKLYETVRPEGIGRDRCIDLLIAGGYRLKRKHRREVTTVAGPKRFPNIIEGMAVSRPNQVWQSDTTYFPLGNGGFGYLTFILDVYSREVKGYEVADTLRSAVNERLLSRTIREQGCLEGLIHHSDRGSQYGSNAYLELQRKHGILTSMGVVAQDNAYAERINGIIKNEYLIYWDIRTLKELRICTQKAVRHYNSQRRHSSIGQMSPQEFLQKWLTSEPSQRPEETVYAEGRKRAGALGPSSFPRQDCPAAPCCSIVC